MSNWITQCWAVHFADVLSEELKNQFKYNTQLQVANNCKSGQNPSTDAAILVLMIPSKIIPTVMYEYKPGVYPDPSRVDVLAVMKCFYKLYCIV